MPLPLDCCGGLNNVDYSKVDLSAMTLLSDYVNVTDPNFIVAVISIAFNPLFWNVVARWEHRTRSLTRIFGSPYVACYFLGVVIILLNFLRTHCFGEAMKSQPKLPLLDCLLGYYASVTLIAVGILLVTSSFLALGFIGTFLGDYFGILMETKVTSFPFNVTENPMYWGSTSIYFGWSLMNASPVGLVLTVVVTLCYAVALLYEGPFTEEIYRNKAPKSK
ncbi:phosphatidylethanolamine N-methyltransferase isoform X1 [Pantherophis guttatus]|uniref:Phosphatidylethanolamine N-methyltransferase n=2 Tax=Pantherophis guttatus TaxID=94885 RepID=A0A6P9DNA7_PANGU|nr:phosphatidylethanolamine N-methyltransferase isoform X1 [Pantherophis guttatus]